MYMCVYIWSIVIIYTWDVTDIHQRKDAFKFIGKKEYDENKVLFVSCATYSAFVHGFYFYHSLHKLHKLL